MANKKVFIVIGTRPEAIKMAPVYRALSRTIGPDVALISTGQHRELLHQAIAAFDLRLDHDLSVMKPEQSLTSITAAILGGLELLFQRDAPDLVLVHGDTTSAFSTALSCFYHAIPLAHVEAGLRTYRLKSPFPEEFNRQTISRLAGFHFAPTEQAKDNLLADGVPGDKIVVTGNTALDALEEILPRAAPPLHAVSRPGGLAAITLHRRVHDARLEQLLSAIREVALTFPATCFVYPVHPNPCIRRSAHAALAMLPNLRLIEPMSYADFIGLLLHADVVITDSGGIQEEANYLGKPVLLVRERTERGDGLGNGCVKVVGCDAAALKSSLESVLSGRPSPCYRRSAPGRRGAADTIAHIVTHRLLGCSADASGRERSLCREAAGS